MKLKTIYFIVYFFIILIATELLLRIFINVNNKKNNSSERYMLYEENEVFKNHEDFFTYHPNKEILNETYYYKENKFIKEYSYFIKTNNFGLVQDNNLIKNKKSILFLGDSFTEGQGYNSWINKFKGSYNNLQVINGGILGVNPTQFYNLEKYLSKNFDINKVIFIYLGDDFIRTSFTIKTSTQNCLKNQNNCIGDEYFYGFSKDNVQNIPSYLQKLRNYRLENYDTIYNIKVFLKQFYFVAVINGIFDKYKYKKNFEENLFYTNKLIQKYNNDIIFVRLNTKQEILLGKKSYWSKKIEKEFENQNIKNNYCNFNNELKLFYKHDSHPNKKGYEYLYNCILKILKTDL